MDKSSARAVLLLTLTLTLLSPAARATLIVEGTNTPLTLSGSNNLPAIVFGYNTTNGAIQSTFSNNFLVNSTGVATSPAITFSTAPVTTLVANKYFVFVLDIQEPGGSQDIIINTISISVNNVIIWQTTDSMLVNSTANKTLTPTGNGADLAVYIPVAAFNGLNLTGASTFVFTSTQSNFGGGNEEWLFTDRGIPQAVSFYPTTATIQEIPGVPEPSTVGLSILGAASLLLRRRMKA